MSTKYLKRIIGVLTVALPVFAFGCDGPNNRGDIDGANEWRENQEEDGDENGVRVVETGQTLFGQSYEDLTSAWSNWLQLEPIGTNPAFDSDGRFCELNQSGPFWFLAGTFGGIADRTCAVPSGKGLFFPIFAFVSFAPEFLGEIPCQDLPTEIEQIRCDVNDDIAIAPFVDLQVVIDGEPVPDLFAYRVDTAPGGFTFVSGPLYEAFGVDPGPRFPAVVDGYWIMLKPLPDGVHTLSFSADYDTDGVPDQGANYTLIVGGDEQGEQDEDG
jgi:hypothetical protein